MRAALGLVLLACTAAATLLAAPAQQTFRTGTQTVMVYVTVRDASGRIIPNLTQDDFRIIDNGRPAAITTFSNEVQPITVALLLDMSSSMNPRLLRARDSTIEFINALLPADRVRLGTFGAEIAMSPLLTGDKAELVRIAREELWPGGGTPLWNAIYAAMDSLAAEPGRRVVLVLTDGLDSGSLPGWKGDFDDVRKRARREGFMLYTIAMEGLVASDKPEVSELIEDTGGAHFTVGADEDLKDTFARVADELRRQYLIGFAPETSDGREHKLEVQVDKPGLKARGRRSYVAARER